MIYNLIDLSNVRISCRKVFKFAFWLNLSTATSLQDFSAVDCLCQVLQRDYKNKIMTSLSRHFIILGLKISIFCETGYKLSTCEVSNHSVI